MQSTTMHLESSMMATKKNWANFEGKKKTFVLKYLTILFYAEITNFNNTNVAVSLDQMHFVVCCAYCEQSFVVHLYYHKYYLRSQ